LICIIKVWDQEDPDAEDDDEEEEEYGYNYRQERGEYSPHAVGGSSQYPNSANRRKLFSFNIRGNKASKELDSSEDEDDWWPSFDHGYRQQVPLNKHQQVPLNNRHTNEVLNGEETLPGSL
jgi:hypothetical protein